MIWFLSKVCHCYIFQSLSFVYVIYIASQVVIGLLCITVSFLLSLEFNVLLQ